MLVISLYPQFRVTTSLQPKVTSRYYYILEIEGVTAGAYVKPVGEINLGETEVIEFQDGQDIILRKRAGRNHFHNLAFQLDNSRYSNFKLWWDEAKKIIKWYMEVQKEHTNRKSISLIMKDTKGNKELLCINFFECWPCKIDLNFSYYNFPTLTFYITTEKALIDPRFLD